METREYRSKSETIVSLLTPLKNHCNEETKQCIEETIRLWDKMERIEKILSRKVGSSEEEKAYNYMMML